MISLLRGRVNLPVPHISRGELPALHAQPFAKRPLAAWMKGT
jgi:hypothetical protein